MFLRRLGIALAVFLLLSCQKTTQTTGKLTIGLVSFEGGARSVEDYSELQKYLGEELNSIVELEPTYNEVKALDEIKRRKWDLVFAPPGVAALAIYQDQYIPIFPLEGGQKTRSIVVVLKNSPVQNIAELSGKTIALGQEGSATSYYLPIYNLYGLTLAEVRFARTPKKVLEAIAKEEVAAGAISLQEFNQYRSDFTNKQFRILYTDTHPIPSGSVLVNSSLPTEKQSQIRKSLNQVSSALASSTGYITNAPIPDYQYLIKVLSRVRPISEKIKQKPAPLY